MTGTLGTVSTSKHDLATHTLAGWLLRRTVVVWPLLVTALAEALVVVTLISR